MLQKPFQGYPVNDLGSINPDFTTAAGITYYCSFRDITALSPIFYSYDIHIYEFAFFGDTSRVPDGVVIPFDRCIMGTVREIITSFLTVPGRIVGYRCDYSDNRHNLRRTRFEREFINSNSAGTGIERVTTELTEVIDGKTYVTYGAIFYMADFPERKLLKDYLIDPAKEIIVK